MYVSTSPVFRGWTRAHSEHPCYPASRYRSVEKPADGYVGVRRHVPGEKAQQINVCISIRMGYMQDGKTRASGRGKVACLHADEGEKYRERSEK